MAEVVSASDPMITDEPTVGTASDVSDLEARMAEVEISEAALVVPAQSVVFDDGAKVPEEEHAVPSSDGVEITVVVEAVISTGASADEVASVVVPVPAVQSTEPVPSVPTVQSTEVPRTLLSLTEPVPSEPLVSVPADAPSMVPATVPSEPVASVPTDAKPTEPAPASPASAMDSPSSGPPTTGTDQTPSTPANVDQAPAVLALPAQEAAGDASSPPSVVAAEEATKAVEPKPADAKAAASGDAEQKTPKTPSDNKKFFSFCKQS